MDGARHQLFAGSTFTQNQHRVCMLAYFFNEPVHSLHLGRNAYQAREARPRPKLFAKYAIFLVYFEQADYPLQLAA